MKLASYYGSFLDFYRQIDMHWTTFTENVRNFHIDILKNLIQTIFCLLPDRQKNCKNELKNDILTCLVWSKKLFWGHHWGWLSKFNPKMFREPQKVTVAPKRAQDITSWQLELRIFKIFKIFRILKISLRWVFSIVKIPQI